MSCFHFLFMNVLSGVIIKCQDKTVKRSLEKYLRVMKKRSQNNYKLSKVHEILTHACVTFAVFEMHAFEGLHISYEFHDLGPIDTYTLHDLLNLLRHKDIRLEGCLANIPSNVHRTGSLTLCYLLAAKDALGDGSMSEVLWNIKLIKGDSP